jgi:branched-chain amino acid transport system substrate-binding protein
MILKRLLARAALLAAAASLVMATGATAQAPSGPPIKIGSSMAMTGGLGPNGKSALLAWKIWEEEVNAKGGLLGRPVEFIISDTEGNPATAVRKAQEMVERNGVRILTGIAVSSEALATVPRLAEWDTIFVSGDNGDGRLTAEALVPNFFRPNVSGPMGTRAVALYLRDSPMKKLFGLGMDYAWGHNSMEVFEAECKRAGKTFAGAVFSPTGTKDFSTYITRIRQSGAEGVYLVLSGDDNAAFLSQAKQYRLGEKVQLLTELIDQMTINATGEATVGLIGGSRYPYTLDNPANKAFVAAWQAEYRTPPDMFEGDQYQSCVVLKAGIEKAGSIEAAKLRAALEGLEVDSIKGRVVMRACDHQGEQRGFVIKIVKREGMAHPVPEVIATYPADRVTPPCNKMVYDN